MSKKKDTFQEIVLDTYKEHAYHQREHSDCSECYKEAKYTRVQRSVNRRQEEFTNEALTRNSFGSNFPLGFQPE